MTVRVPPSGQAAKLAVKYLKSQSIDVSHSQGLEVVARVRGHRDWQAMQAVEKTAQAAAGSTPANPSAKPAGLELARVKALVAAARKVVTYADNTGCSDDMTVTSLEAIEALDECLDTFEDLQATPDARPVSGNPALSGQPAGTADLALAVLEMRLRMQGFSETDLDELVHDAASPSAAASINNQGLAAQLRFLLEQEDGKPSQLVECLERALEGFDAGAIGVCGTVSAGTSLSYRQFDALPWLVQATPQALHALLDSGCVSPAVPSRHPDAVSMLEWVFKSGQVVRTNGHKAFDEFMAAPNFEPMQVHVDVGQVRVFLNLRRHALAPEQYSSLSKRLDSCK